MSIRSSFIGLVAILLAACTSTGTTGTTGTSGSAASPDLVELQPAGQSVEITIGTAAGSDLRFEPDVVTVPEGAAVTVVFENRSSVAHNLTFPAAINAASSPIVGIGATETVEFIAPGPGEYTFVCNLHPGMEGTLVVEPGG